MRLKTNVPTRSLVMLAAFETVPGTKSILLAMSALPAAPIHVPFRSFTNNEIPGNPFFVYFSSNAFNAAFFGWRLLLSVHEASGPTLLVSVICAFLHATKEAHSKRINTGFIALRFKNYWK